MGSETPEQFYATERRGNTLKGVMTTVSKDMYTPVRKLRNMSSYRARAYEFFVRWDSDEKVGRAASDNGLSYCNEARKSEHGLQVGALVLD